MLVARKKWDVAVDIQSGINLTYSATIYWSYIKPYKYTEEYKP